MAYLDELIEKRNRAFARCREIHGKAEEEKRSLTDEENANYDAAWDEYQKLDAEIDKRQRLAEAEKKLGEPEGRRALATDPTDNRGGAPDGRQARPIVGMPEHWVARLAGHDRAQPEYDDAWRRYLAGGEGAIRGRMAEILMAGSRDPRADERALSSGTDTEGGYISASIQWASELIQAKDELLFIRQLARTIPVTKGARLGTPSLDADPSDAAWSTELTRGAADSTMAFGKRELEPHILKKYLLVSKRLLRVSVINVDALVRDRLAYKIAVPEENAFLNGSGSNQPLGVYIASDLGIGTGQDVSTGNTTTSMTFDGLIEVKYKLYKYWADPSMAWCFHPDGGKQLTKLKDGEGRYIWREGVAAGEPNRLLGFPVRLSAYNPNTFTTGLYVGILGAWKNYWIADSLDILIQVLIELYAATGQNGYHVEAEIDGMPVLAEAFARVKLA